MSASRLSRNNVIAIVVVVIMGIGVTVLNIQTFGKARRPHRPVQVQARDQLPLPADLATLVYEAGRPQTEEQTTAPSTVQERPRLKRDPFLSNRKKVQLAQTSQPVTDKQSPLACTAVVVGGRQNAALINGKTYAAGDRVEGLTVQSVSTKGVTLVDGGGKKVFLTVRDQDSESPALMMEFSPKKTNQKVVMDMTERKQP